ncbi:Alpha/Beta hydrolase protein [Thamnidium elegans]|nr:Alpha/Beta hydrolase protein [Thamnidium elegans]
MPDQYLQVDGANLCYEMEGSGPYIVFVAGGNGGSILFRPFRNLLVKHFTVILYDRRGYFRSKLTGPQDYTRRIDTDVDDLYNLMRSITKEKFIIFGISSSGVVLMNYLKKYPDTIHKLFAHEPAVNIFNVSNEKDIWEDHQAIYDTYKKLGRNSAMVLFGKYYLNELDEDILVRKQWNDRVNNWDYFFEHEWQVYQFTNVDADEIEPYKDKLVFLYGAECTDYFVCKPSAVFAKSLGKERLEFPGGHIGFFTECKKFYPNFIKLCREHSLILDQPRL